MLVIGPQWLPFEGSWTRSGLRDCPVCVVTQRFNPSVTAAPCHLPLHKGGFNGRYCKLFAIMVTFIIYCMIKNICRGRCCGVAQRSMPHRGIEPHERAGFAGWRPSLWPPSADAPDGLTINCHQQPQGQQQYPTVGADSISARMGRQHKLRTGHRGRCTLQINVHIL